MKVKTERDNLVRDTRQGALLNTNASGLNLYRERRAQMKAQGKQEEEIKRLDTRIDSIEGKLDQILEALNG